MPGEQRPPAPPSSSKHLIATPWLKRIWLLSLGFMEGSLRSLTRVFVRLVPLLATCLFLGILWFDFGLDYNVPELVWQVDEPFWQFMTAFSIGLLLAYVWHVAYLVDARLHAEAQSAQVSDDAQLSPWHRVRAHVIITWLVLATLLVIPAFYDLYHRWPFLLGVLAAGIIVFTAPTLFAPVFWVWERIWLRLEPWLGWSDRLFGPQNATSVHVDLVRTAQLTFLLLFLMFVAFVIYLPDTFPPVIAACVLLGVLTGTVGAFCFHCRLWAWLPLTAIALWVVVVCNSYAYKLRLPGLDQEYSVREKIRLTAEEEPRPAAQADNAEELENLRQLFRRFHRQVYGPTAGPGLPNLDRLTYAELYNQYQGLGSIAVELEKQKLDNWRRHLHEREDPYTPLDSYKPKLAIVTVSGGANRSAYWTGLVLKKLEDELRKSPDGSASRPFPEHVRLVAGASGGMVGAAQYVVTLGPEGHDDNHPFVPDRLADDFLTPIINRTVFREAPYLLAPIEYYADDRGKALEEAMERTTPELKVTFAALKEGEERGWRPALVFSPMIVEDGRRLLISNLNLRFMTISDGSYLLQRAQPEAAPAGKAERAGAARRAPLDGSGKRSSRASPNQAQQFPPGKSGKQKDDPYADIYSRSAVELFRLFPSADDHFKVSTAARLNASFPFASPAVDLPTSPPRRVVDAGYYDNYGVNVAARWIYEHRQWIRDHTSGIVLVQIRDSRSQTLRRQLFDSAAEPEAESELSRRLTSGLQWFTAPLSGAGNARQSVMSFRNDEQVEVLSDFFAWPEDQRDRPPFFTTVVFEQPGKVGMNWYLTELDKLDIRNGFAPGTDAAKTNLLNLQNLKAWWHQ